MNGVFCPNEMSEKFEIEFFQSTSTEKEKMKEREKKEKKKENVKNPFFSILTIHQGRVLMS